MPQGIEAAALLYSFPTPHSMIGLFVSLMQYVSACQCNGVIESPIVLVLQILELMNICMVKDRGEHCYQDQGLYQKETY